MELSLLTRKYHWVIKVIKTTSRGEVKFSPIHLSIAKLIQADF
ncbi:hypothetical protein D082_07230 [Synechocystis sp. PCC 6714]|nr:hypothetical protein D082_07230 [Synechocystis sp. PCC 6714]